MGVRVCEHGLGRSHQAAPQEDLLEQIISEDCSALTVHFQIVIHRQLSFMVIKLRDNLLCLSGAHMARVKKPESNSGVRDKSK